MVGALVALLLIASCSNRETPSNDDQQSARPGFSVASTTVDPLIGEAFSRLRDGLEMRSMALEYVQADGTLHPQYGVARFETGRRFRPAPPPPPPPDDPDRPIGAPMPEAPRRMDPIIEEMVADATTRCPTYQWRASGREPPGEGSCRLQAAIAKPRCSILQIWKRALDEGAPAAGLARIELGLAAPTTWTFTISDPPRGIDFRGRYEDDCPPMAEKP